MTTPTPPDIAALIEQATHDFETAWSKSKIQSTRMAGDQIMRLATALQRLSDDHDPTDDQRAAANRLMTAAQDGKIRGDDLQMIFDATWVNNQLVADLHARIALTAERDALRERLRPFAEHADAWHDDEPDDTELIEGFDSADHGFFVPPITLGDLRAARQALAQDGEKG